MDRMAAPIQLVKWRRLMNKTDLIKQHWDGNTAIRFNSFSFHLNSGNQSWLWVQFGIYLHKCVFQKVRVQAHAIWTLISALHTGSFSTCKLQGTGQLPTSRLWHLIGSYILLLFVSQSHFFSVISFFLHYVSLFLHCVY